MNDAAYGEFLGVVDDAIALAEDAVKEAQREVTPASEPITLVKVAKARCCEVAAALIKSGAFPDKTEEDLAKTLEMGGSSTHLELLEKVASRAVFPFDLEGDLGGELVEKSSSTRVDNGSPETKTELWARSWAEAEVECAG